MVYRYELSDFEYLAERLGGKLDSNKYVNQDTKLYWECRYGHKFQKAPVIIINKFTWCTKCKKGHVSKDDIEKAVRKMQSRKSPLSDNKIDPEPLTEEAKEFLEKFQNELDTRMFGARLKDNNVFLGEKKFHKVLCARNHNIKILYSKLILETEYKCHLCGQIPDSSIQDFVDVIKNKNGILMTPYINDKTKVRIQCENKHEWEATPNNVKAHNSWCPQCSSTFNEERCRLILNNLLDANLIKVRPNFLLYGETRKCLELDGYDEKQRIAFEYNGIQHYETMYYDGDNGVEEDARLEHQKRKDAFKEKQCRKLDIILLTISYEFVKNKKDKDVIKYLASILKENNLKINEEQLQTMLDNGLNPTVFVGKRMQRYKERAYNACKERGGKIADIDDVIINTPLDKFKVACKFDHIFEIYINNLEHKTFRWCPICTQDFVNKKAALKNMTLLHQGVQIINIERTSLCEVLCLNCGEINKNIWLDDVGNHCDSKKEYELVIYDCDELEEFKVVLSFSYDLDDYKYIMCQSGHIHKILSNKIGKYKCQECFVIEEVILLKETGFEKLDKIEGDTKHIYRCKTCDHTIIKNQYGFIKLANKCVKCS